MTPTTSLAFLVRGGTEDGQILYATQKPSGLGDQEPFSAVTRLIQGIYQTYPDQARKICRSRIYTTQPSLTPFCRGMIHVAAKRVTLLEPGAPHPDLLSARLQDLTHWNSGTVTLASQELEQTLHTYLSQTPSPPKSLDNWAQLTHRLVSELPRNSIRHQSNRPIVALLLGQTAGHTELSLLAAAQNENAKNRTLHAEVNLIQNWYRNTGRAIPEGSVILTSLKPCRMCAGLIWQTAQNRRQLKVIYLENDPGPNAQNTALEPHTFDRKMAATQPEELELEILKEWAPLRSSKDSHKAFTPSET